MKLAEKQITKQIMKQISKQTLKLGAMIALPLSVLCLSANAATSTASAPATSTKISAKAAATPAATSTVAAPKKEEAASVKFGLSYDLGYTMQSQEQTDAKTGAKSRSQSLSHEFMPTLAYGEYNSLALIAYSQDLIDTTDNKWSDLSLNVGKKAWALGSYFNLGPSIGGVLPLKDSTRYEMGLLYSFNVALKLSLNTKALGMDAWKISYQGRLARNNLIYDTNAKTGNPNTLYGYRNRFFLGYDITSALSISTQLDFSANYSVNGVVNNTFSHFQALGYTLNEGVSISLGHSNEGSYLKAGDYENNLKFFNPESSEYSVGLSLSI